MKISNFEIFNCQVVKYLKFLTFKSPNKFSNCRNSPQWKFQISKFPIVKCLKFPTSKSPNKFSNCRNSNFEISNCQVKSSCQVFEISKLQISKQIFELWKFQWKFQISKFPIVKLSSVWNFQASNLQTNFRTVEIPHSEKFKFRNFQLSSQVKLSNVWNFQPPNLQTNFRTAEIQISKFSIIKSSQVVKCLKFLTSKSPNKFSNCRNSPQWKIQISKFPIVKLSSVWNFQPPNLQTSKVWKRHIRRFSQFSTTECRNFRNS